MVDGQPLRVGIIGADAKASWAGVSHVPAIAALPNLTLSAVATRSENSAREATNAFGAAHAFGDPLALIHSGEVDIVTVAVRVPAHRDLVLAALAAGKTVYSESPRGRTVAEGEEMARSAAAAGIHTAIGLQARYNPSLPSLRRTAPHRRDRTTADRADRLDQPRVRARFPSHLRLLQQGGVRRGLVDDHGGAHA